MSPSSNCTFSPFDLLRELLGSVGRLEEERKIFGSGIGTGGRICRLAGMARCSMGRGTALPGGGTATT